MKKSPDINFSLQNWNLPARLISVPAAIGACNQPGYVATDDDLPVCLGGTWVAPLPAAQRAPRVELPTTFKPQPGMLARLYQRLPRYFRFAARNARQG
jgi:hypothetical protein